jgi:hypothetical protein
VSDAIELSESGRARREAMLRELKLAVVSRRRRRLAARWSIAAALPLAAALLLPLVLNGHRAPVGPTPSAVAPPYARLDFGVVHTDPGIVERHAINDEELIALFSDAQQPAGLIRIGGHVVLAQN